MFFDQAADPATKDKWDSSATRNSRMHRLLASKCEKIMAACPVFRNNQLHGDRVLRDCQDVLGKVEGEKYSQNKRPAFVLGKTKDYLHLPSVP